jgi:hypothetical protein
MTIVAESKDVHILDHLKVFRRISQVHHRSPFHAPNHLSAHLVPLQIYLNPKKSPEGESEIGHFPYTKPYIRVANGISALVARPC